MRAKGAVPRAPFHSPRAAPLRGLPAIAKPAVRPFSSRTRILQWLDRWAGVPTCFFLTQARRLGSAFGTDSDRPVRSILFLKLAEQGSTVLAHEAVRIAVQRVGRDNVHFLVFEENRFIVDLIGLVPPGNVVTVPTASAWAMAAGGLRALAAVRTKGIDACVDMEFFSRFSAAIAYLSGARMRVGFHVFFGEGPYRGDLMTHRVLYNPHLHTSRSFTSLVLAMNADPVSLPTLGVVPPWSPPLPQFTPSEAEVKGVVHLLGAAGVPEGGRIIVLNANASDLLPLRRWAAGNYVELASRLIEAIPGVRIAFTGSAAEAPVVGRLVASVGSDRAVSVAGKTSLRQLLVLFGLAEVLVTNDSGPAHFAALTAVDVVALFGPETPLLFSAPGPRSHPVWAGIACSPCVNAFNNRQTACRDNVCMKSIAVGDVFEKVRAIYASRVS